MKPVFNLFIIASFFFFVINSVLISEALQGEARLDSLLEELPNSKGDSVEVNLLTTISYQLYTIDPDKGIEYGDKAVELAEKINYRKGKAYALNTLGLHYSLGKSEYKKGLMYYNQSLDLMKEFDDTRGLGIVYGNLGIIAELEFDYDKALDYYNKSLDMLDEMDDRDGVARNLGNIGNLFSIQRNYSEALEHYKQAIEIYKETGNKRGQARNLSEIGLLYDYKSEYANSLKYYAKALEINEAIGDKYGMSVVYGNIGQIFYKKSEYISALKYYDKALMINEELGDKDGKARTYIRKGNVYTAKVDYYKAEELFEKALSINKEIGNKYGISSTLGNLGLLYYSQADYPKALEYYLKSLKINREIENTLGAADNMGNIGMIHNILLNQKKALEYFNQALQDMKEIDDKEGTSRVLYNIGESYLIKKQYDKALEYFEKSYDISDKIGNKKTTALTLGSIGQVHFARGEFRTALDYYEKALAGSKEIGDEAGEINQLKNIGELYIKSIKDKNKPYLVDNSQLLGLNNEVKLNRSIEYFSKSSSYYAKTNQLLRLSIAYKLLHEAYKLKGDYENALSIFTRYNELKDSIFSNEKVNQISELEKAREEDLKQKEIEKQKIRIAEQEKREQLILYFSIGLVLLLTVVMIIIYRLLKRSDKLLYNVLPISIAKRLKNKEHPISDYFTQASIVFIDIVNFTEMARDADPRKIVEDLNKIFTHYDTIANKYGLEKIKTIGDSYMAAAGIPEVQKDNTHRAAQMALEVKEVMNDYRTVDGIRIEVRIGLDCGPVVAGVIGENKFIYDMWSDAVNTASRMESSSVAGQVHITERFKIAVSEYEDFEYEERGEIAVKGKGKMNTYFMGGKVNAG